MSRERLTGGYSRNRAKGRCHRRAWGKKYAGGRKIPGERRPKDHLLKKATAHLRENASFQPRRTVVKPEGIRAIRRI